MLLSESFHQSIVSCDDSIPVQVVQSGPAPGGEAASLLHLLALSHCSHLLQLACCCLMDVVADHAPQSCQMGEAMSSEPQSFHAFLLYLASVVADLQVSCRFLVPGFMICDLYT